LNRALASIGDADDIWYILTNLARDILTDGSRHGLALIALVIVAHRIPLVAALVLRLANPARNTLAAPTVAHIVHHGVTDLLGEAHWPQDLLANRIGAIAAFLLIAGLTLAVVLGPALIPGSLDLFPIASVRHLVGSIQGFEDLGFQVQSGLLLLKRKRSSFRKFLS
jgi:hypothetical protein